jgi:ATPases of the AAA+ class
MGWRFRKYITIFPGVRLNISKSGISFTFGAKGASVNVGKDGAYLNTSIPGTGLYNRQKIYSGKDKLEKGQDTSKQSINKKEFSNSSINVDSCVYDDPETQIVHFSIGEDDKKSTFEGTEHNTIKENEHNMIDIPNIGFLDPMLYDAAVYVVSNQSCSTSMIQRHFSVGYNRANRLVDQLEQIGIVKHSNNFKWEVLIKDSITLDSLFASLKTDGFSENIFGITEDYYKDVTAIVYSLVKLYQDIKNDITVMYAIADCLPQYYGNKEQKLAALFHADIMKVHQHFGHSTINLKNREGFALVLLSSLILGEGCSLDLTYGNINKLEDLSESVPSVFSSLSHIFDQYFDENFFFIGQVLNRCKRRSFYTRYFTLLYRLFSFIAKADNSITENETIWLNKLLELNPQKENVNIVFNVGEASSYKPIGPQEQFKKQESDRQKSDNQESKPIEELNKLIGLGNVKTEINSLSNLVKVQQVRKARGMSVSNISYHCVFTGNPGTGKTTVARIVAEIYKDLGVLKKGHLIETDRSGLVGEYVGQTAPKTNAIIDSALDGVLFIDEAYSLVQGGQSDYGKEAISTLLKRMEDERDRLVVILAGYSKEMEDFINSNSGLQSRFNRYIDFPDYSSSELNQIFDFIIKKNDFVLTDEATKQVEIVISNVIEHKDKNFGNGRYVRNLFEKIITQQANRIALEQNITNEMLSKIEAIDIINATK